jgi:uncharacterized protein with ParB-like and HNH nuclease domain
VKECQQLWDDILQAGRRDTVPAHFVGSTAFVEKGRYQISSQSPLLVIDGQQRLVLMPSETRPQMPPELEEK